MSKNKTKKPNTTKTRPVKLINGNEYKNNNGDTIKIITVVPSKYKTHILLEINDKREHMRFNTNEISDIIEELDLYNINSETEELIELDNETEELNDELHADGEHNHDETSLTDDKETESND